jgi:tRNA 2-thiouridine synthesizing protein A
MSTTTTLDLIGLKCPWPALKTRHALARLTKGAMLEVHCSDPLAAIDIPNLIRETGDRLERTDRGQDRMIFVIEKIAGGDRPSRIGRGD